MAKKNKNRKFKYRVVFLIPLCIGLMIAIFASVGSYWVKIANKYQEKKDLENQIVALKEKEEELKVDVEKG